MEYKIHLDVMHFESILERHDTSVENSKETTAVDYKPMSWREQNNLTFKANQERKKAEKRKAEELE